MSKTTTNYHLIKPELTDAADITAMNQNWDKIDTELSKRASLDSTGKIPIGQIPSNSFIVNVTDNGETFVADKTFSEVLAAYNAGKTLMAYYNEYRLPLTIVDVSQYFAFQTGTDYGYMAFLILVDNTVGSIFETFTTQGHRHSATDILGTLSVEKGGTGNTSVDTTPTSGSTKMVTSGGVYTALSGKAASSHNQAASTITAGTLAGQVKANASAVSTVGTAQLRNIYAGTSDMTAGSSSLTTGDIYFVYE